MLNRNLWCNGVWPEQLRIVRRSNDREYESKHNVNAIIRNLAGYYRNVILETFELRLELSTRSHELNACHEMISKTVSITWDDLRTILPLWWVCLQDSEEQKLEDVRWVAENKICYKKWFNYFEPIWPFMLICT